MLRHVLIHYLLFGMLNVQVDVHDSLAETVVNLLSHRMKLVRVLAESLRIFSEVDLDVGHVANLIGCENTKDTLFCNRLDIAAFEAHHVGIQGSCLVTSQSLAEKWNDCFDVTSYLSGGLHFLVALVYGLLKDFGDADFRRSDVTKVGSLCVLTASILVKQFFRMFDDLVDIFFGLQRSVYIHLTV